MKVTFIIVDTSKMWGFFLVFFHKCMIQSAWIFSSHYHPWQKYHNWNYKDIQQKTGVGKFNHFSCILIMSHTSYVAVCGGWDTSLSTVPEALWEQKLKGLMGQQEIPALERTRIYFLIFIVLRFMCCSQILLKKSYMYPQILKKKLLLSSCLTFLHCFQGKNPQLSVQLFNILRL